MDKATAMHQEMARIGDQLGIHDSPSAPVAPEEPVNAGRQTPAHARGVSSQSVWKGDQDDPWKCMEQPVRKGVTGVDLDNQNDIEPIPERDPVEKVRKDIMRDELNNLPSSLRGGKRSRSPSEASEAVNPQPKGDQPIKINSTVGNYLLGETWKPDTKLRLHWQATWTQWRPQKMQQSEGNNTDQQNILGSCN